MAYSFRKGINFATKLDKYYKKEKAFSLLRRISLVLTGLTVITAFILIFLNVRTLIKLRNLAIKRKTLIDSLLEHSTQNEKLSVIADKTEYTRKLLDTQDVRFIAYYKVVTDLIDEISNESTSSAVKINNFQLTKNREVKFELSTSNPETYLQILNSIDSDEFLSNFERLTLKNFSISGNANESSYTLTFEGKFKKKNVQI